MRAAVFSVLALPLAALAGCGPQIPLWSADYARAQTTRTYAVPPANALAAAEAVVQAAGAQRDVQVTPTDHGARVARYVLRPVGLSTVTMEYDFDITVAPSGSGSTVQVAISATGGSEFEDAVTLLPPLLANGPVGVADPYKLFFARMDYILGKRGDWVSCAAAPAALGAQVALEPLCDRALAGPPVLRR